MLWNVDLTLVDVAQVTRQAYAEAFERVTGRPLVRLAPAAGRPDSEVVFETLALNGIEPTDRHLPEFFEAFVVAFAARAPEIPKTGRALPGAREALAAVRRVPGVVQTVLTGGVEASTVAKLTAFGLDAYLDLEIGGYGSEAFPKGTLVEVVRGRAVERYGGAFPESATVVVTDSVRDVAAARIGNAAVVAVASGRNTLAELRAHGADVVLDDLTDTAAVVRSVEQLTGPLIGGAEGPS